MALFELEELFVERVLALHLLVVNELALKILDFFVQLIYLLRERGGGLEVYRESRKLLRQKRRRALKRRKHRAYHGICGRRARMHRRCRRNADNQHDEHADKYFECYGFVKLQLSLSFAWKK